MMRMNVDEDADHEGDDEAEDDDYDKEKEEKDENNDDDENDDEDNYDDDDDDDDADDDDDGEDYDDEDDDYYDENDDTMIILIIMMKTDADDINRAPPRPPGGVRRHPVCDREPGAAVCGEPAGGPGHAVRRHDARHPAGLHPQHGLRPHGGLPALRQGEGPPGQVSGEDERARSRKHSEEGELGTLELSL